MLKMFIKSINLRKGVIYKKFTKYDLYINDEKIINWHVIWNKNKSQMNKLIRNQKSINYETVFLLKNKKGFNTFLNFKNYDIIITDRFGEIIDILENIDNNYSSDYYNKGYYLFIFPVGSIKHFNISSKKRITFLKNYNRNTIIDII